MRGPKRTVANGCNRGPKAYVRPADHVRRGNLSFACSLILYSSIFYYRSASFSGVKAVPSLISGHTPSLYPPFCFRFPSGTASHASLAVSSLVVASCLTRLSRVVIANSSPARPLRLRKRGDPTLQSAEARDRRHASHRSAVAGGPQLSPSAWTSAGGAYSISSMLSA